MPEEQPDNDLREEAIREFGDLIEDYWWGHIPHSAGFSDLLDHMTLRWLTFRLHAEWKQLSENGYLLPGMSYEQFRDRSVECAERISDARLLLATKDVSPDRQVDFARFLLYLTGQLSSLNEDGQVIPAGSDGRIAWPREKTQGALIGTIGTICRFHLMVEAVDALRCAEGKRYERLMSLFGAGEYVPRTRRFLAWTSRLYLFGFDLPCLIMCRGAVEAGFESSFSDDECRDAIGPKEKNQKDYTFYQRVEVAQRRALITRKQAKLAITIRTIGNMAAH